MKLLDLAENDSTFGDYTEGVYAEPTQAHSLMRTERQTCCSEIEIGKGNVGFLKLTNEEILKMPKHFRKKFKAGLVTAHIRYRDKKGYEIRCQVNKNKISVSGTTIERAKEKFLNAIAEFSVPVIRTKTPKKPQRTEILLVDYMQKWLRIVKEPSVKPITYKNYLQSFNYDIAPYFSGKDIRDIRQLELQEFFNRYSEGEKHRTSKKVYQLLAAVYEYAVNDGILDRSPMKLVKIAKYEQTHGVPLSREEEKELVTLLKRDAKPCLQAFVFLAYTGLRRSELRSATVADGWITVVSSKQRKGYKEKTRALPIPPILKQLLPFIDVERIKTIYPHNLTQDIKLYFPSHHLHDLRHTFITRAQECGIQRELVSLWAGHAADSSITTTVYTHLEYNKQHQIDEMQKFFYEI